MTLKIRLFLTKTNYYWLFRAGPAHVTQSPPSIMFKLLASSPGIFLAPGSCEPPLHGCSTNDKNSEMSAYPLVHRLFSYGWSLSLRTILLKLWLR